MEPIRKSASCRQWKPFIFTLQLNCLFWILLPKMNHKLSRWIVDGDFSDTVVIKLVTILQLDHNSCSYHQHSDIPPMNRPHYCNITLVLVFWDHNHVQARPSLFSTTHLKVLRRHLAQLWWHRIDNDSHIITLKLVAIGPSTHTQTDKMKTTPALLCDW